MKHLILVICFVATIFSLFNCASSLKSTVNDLNIKLEQDGSPYRWKHEDLGGGVESLKKYLVGTVSPTVADKKLAQEINVLIAAQEGKQGHVDGKVIEIRKISSSENSVTEAWVVKRSDQSDVAYTVALRPVLSGGTDISLKGPWK